MSGVRHGRPTLAAVVLNHNYARFVADAVRSLTAQTEAFDEIVVVDDGSTDDSLDVLAPLGVRVVRKENGGQLSAALAGLEATTAEYVYFLDADDTAAPELVATVAPALLDEPVKVQFPLRGVDADLRPTGSVFPAVPAGYGSSAMVHDNTVLGFYTCPPTSGNVYRRSTLAALELSRLDQRDFIDGPATLVLPHLGRITCLDVPLANYRVHGGNHSSWGRPDPAQLRHEISWFERRWEQACVLLGTARPPFGNEPAYVLERRLMASALQGTGGTVRLAIRFTRRLAGAHLPPVHRVALSAWAFALVLPFPRLRTAAVYGRRSPEDRPAVLGRALRFSRELRGSRSGRQVARA